MKKHYFLLLALAMLFGVKVFGQEWEYSIPCYMSAAEMTHQYSTYEMSDGRIIVSAQLLYNDGSYPYFPYKCIMQRELLLQRVFSSIFLVSDVV